MSLRRTSSGIVDAALLADAREKRGWAPAHADIYGPVCDLCGAVVDSEELVEGQPGGLGPDPNGVMTETPASSRFARVLVSHHGAEELHTFDFESIWWNAEDLKRRMQHRRWFCPLEDAPPR
jgi:hypothetical protein